MPLHLKSKSLQIQIQLTIIRSLYNTKYEYIANYRNYIPTCPFETHSLYNASV